MPGPNTPDDARKWARLAMSEGRYRPSRHFDERMEERQVTMLDVSMVFARCRTVIPTADPPRHDGTCWRAYGSNIDGTMEIGVGFEAYVGDNLNRIILCTVLPPREK